MRRGMQEGLLEKEIHAVRAMRVGKCEEMDAGGTVGERDPCSGGWGVGKCEERDAGGTVGERDPCSGGGGGGV